MKSLVVRRDGTAEELIRILRCLPKDTKFYNFCFLNDTNFRIDMDSAEFENSQIRSGNIRYENGQCIVTIGDQVFPERLLEK